MFGKKKDKIIIEDIEKSEDDEYNELCGKNRKNIIKICKIKQNNDLKYLTYFFKFFFDEKFHDELYTYCKLYTECFNEFITSFKKIQNFFNKNSKFNFEIKNNTTIINLFGCVNTLYKNSYYKIKPKNIILVCKEILNPERNLLGSKREKFNSDFFKKAIHEDLKEYINFLSLQKTPYSTKKLETDTDYYLKSSVFDGDEKDRYAIEMITEDMKNLFKAFINISVLEKKKTYLEEIDSINQKNIFNIKINTDLTEFIDEIIVSPFAPDYYLTTLHCLFEKMNMSDLKNKIRKSNMIINTEYK